MIYLDNAATTQKKPQAVIDAVCTAMNLLGNAGRGTHAASLAAMRTVYDARVRVAELFHAAEPKQVVFTMNATQSLNMAIRGTLKKGDHVITTVMEHNSVIRPLYAMEEEGVEVTHLPVNAACTVPPSAFEAAIRPHTRAIVCTHCSNLTGNLIDIQSVGQIARKHGLLFIVDVSQTAGVFPIDMEQMNIDILCFTGHKSLLGPQGTGGLVIRPGTDIKPILAGGTGVHTFSHFQPKELPARLEAGTLNGHGIAGLDAAVEYINKTGMDVIRDREISLMKRFYDGVREIPDIRIYGDFSSMNRCPIVALNIADYDSAEVSDELFSRFDIATRPGGHCAPLMHEALGTKEQGAVRFSFSQFNTEEEIDKVIRAVGMLVMEG
jgi:cysteine desulfurase family protein